MACRGVHFALTAEDEARLLEHLHDDARLQAVIHAIEERWDEAWLQETDKAWDAIHRCLTNGTLEFGPGPFHKCILGRDNLIEGDNFLINHLTSAEVREVAAAIKPIDRAWLRRKYDAIEAEDYDGYLSDEDFEYTWRWFVPLQAFLQKAAEHNRAVVFTADQ